MSETINHPSHYGGDTVYEAIKVIEAWDLGFNLGNTVKYISRAGKKTMNSIEDLKKARWYLDREIERGEQANSLANTMYQQFNDKVPQPSGPLTPTAEAARIDKPYVMDKRTEEIMNDYIDHGFSATNLYKGEALKALRKGAVIHHDTDIVGHYLAIMSDDIIATHTGFKLGSAGQFFSDKLNDPKFDRGWNLGKKMPSLVPDSVKETAGDPQFRKDY